MSTKQSKCYTGIDVFRLVCAVLVIAVHTSPLLSFSGTGDFWLTRVAARVAVPFFFMTSGFFLLSGDAYHTDRLTAFIKKTAGIYGAAILLYLPVNVYSGYFGIDSLVWNVIGDIAFDGTFYHLWYLPASIAGAVIAWHLVRKFGHQKALAVSFILYLTGLFGDSYYGIAQELPVLKGFYDLAFQLSDHTRNGIFFAPVFFILGGFIAAKPHKISFLKSVCGAGASLALMTVEAFILRRYRLQRHDSMYIFLVPCMYYLFHAVLRFQGKRMEGIRTAALIIYIVHPMMIVVTRLFAKLFHLQGMLVENSIVHFGVVCLASVLSGAAGAAWWKKYRAGTVQCDVRTQRAWVEIDLANLEHNARTLEGAMPQGCRLMAVVKAEGYGHGGVEVSAHLNKAGVRAFAVATIDEGIKLRKHGIRGEILILGYTSVCRAAELKRYDLAQALIGFDYADALNKRGITVKAHIKIDTGMHRLGIGYGEFSKVKKVFYMKHIRICGIFTHLCCPDSLGPEDIAFTQKQIDRFYSLANALKDSGIPLPKIHIQSSYGLLNYPGLHCDYVRAGIALYGVLSSPRDATVLKPDLRPVLSLKSRIVLIRFVRKGSSIGYGRSFTAGRDSRIAVLPVGYGDGFPRILSGRDQYVMINGKYAAIVGKICMDQLAADVTDIENAAVGDTAILIGSGKGQDLTASMTAYRADSISNELLCRMGARLPVVCRRAE